VLPLYPICNPMLTSTRSLHGFHRERNIALTGNNNDWKADAKALYPT
jgi:hypothetical protein